MSTASDDELGIPIRPRRDATKTKTREERNRMNPRGDAGRSTHRRQKCKLAARRHRCILFTRRRLCGDSRPAASARVDIHFLRERCVIHPSIDRSIDAFLGTTRFPRDAITMSSVVTHEMLKSARSSAAPNCARVHAPCHELPRHNFPPTHYIFVVVIDGARPPHRATVDITRETHHQSSSFDDVGRRSTPSTPSTKM